MFQFKRLPRLPPIFMLVLVMGMLGHISYTLAVELIAHPSVPNHSLSQSQSRGIFIGRISHWEDGSAIRVFVLPETSAIHQEFAKQLLDLYPYQLRVAWNRIMFTGIGQAPVMLSSEAEMRRRVSETPGAIGYISKVQSNDKVRALPIR